jgi:predicted secreted hydrolase
LRFPADHAAHEDFRIEWWYYTGNLRAVDGHEFGYELTFFRTGIAVRPENPSRWAVRDLYMVHFAISDIASARFRHFQRLARAGVGWAGAATDRYRVWNGDWEARLDGETHQLTAHQGDAALDLQLVSQKPPVLHGDRGLSRKGPSPGNASYYYSLTRLATQGKLSLDGKTYEVAGLSWMDHEFSSSFLEPGQQGWDWLSLQLDDRRELMLYRIRRSDGRVDPFSSATLVDAQGHARHLRAEQFTLMPGNNWHSPQTGGDYPLVWTVRIPDAQLEIRVDAAFAGQELDTRSTTGLAYWEGSIWAQGNSAGQPVHGRGYLEMTGYAGKPLGGSLGGESSR